MKHKIKSTPKGCQLLIWEPAKVTEDRPAPYLYRIKLDFETEDGAIAYLTQHELNYGANHHGSNAPA